MSADSLLIILVIGAIAGWLAGLIVQGTGFGLIADIAIGIVGALLGNWLLPRLGIRVGTGLLSEIVVATIGAIVLLLILWLFRRGTFSRIAPGRGVFLTPPSFPIFLISVVLAIVAFLMTYGGMRFGFTFRPFDILTIAYLVMLAGVVFRGI